MAPAAGPKTYDELVVVALLMSLKAKGGTIAEAVKDMAALDGKRSVSGFEHSLRAPNKLAGVLNEKKTRGEALGPDDIGGVGGGSPTTPRKRGGWFFFLFLMGVGIGLLIIFYFLVASDSAASTPVKRARSSKVKNEVAAVDGEECRFFCLPC